MGRERVATGRERRRATLKRIIEKVGVWGGWGGGGGGECTVEGACGGWGGVGWVGSSGLNASLFPDFWARRSFLGLVVSQLPQNNLTDLGSSPPKPLQPRPPPNPPPPPAPHRTSPTHPGHMSVHAYERSNMAVTSHARHAMRMGWSEASLSLGAERGGGLLPPLIWWGRGQK